MFKIQVVDSIDSTNEALKRLVKEAKASGGEHSVDVLHGTVVIAKHQTAGKGRRGRSFYSPEDTGLYMSILFKPEVKMEQMVRITTMAAAAVSCAIEKVSGKKTEIKWVNDIYADGKKVVGILTEAGPDYAILGIGVNLWEPKGGFPEEIRNIAGALNLDVGNITVGNDAGNAVGNAADGNAVVNAVDGNAPNGAIQAERAARDVVRMQLAEEILSQIEHFYPELTYPEQHRSAERTYMDEYRKRSMVLHQWVTVLTPDHEETDEVVFVDAIGEEAELIITGKDGSKRSISSGEVSIKMK